MELLHYSAMMVEHINWQNRDQYLDNMQDFFDGRISIQKFEIKFFKIQEAIERADKMMENNLIVLEPDPKSFEFARLITIMFLYCEAFYDSPDELNDLDVSEKKLQNFVEKTIPKIKTFYD